MLRMERLFLKNSSLLGGVLWRVLPVSIAVLVGIWMVVIQASKQSLEMEAINRIAERTEGLVLATDARLSNVLYAVRNLSATSLIVNALIHEDYSEDASSGDKGYINTFFRSLKIAGLTQVSFRVLDYKGRQLIGAVGEDYQKQPWVGLVMSGGEQLSIDPERRMFLFATPIEYQGVPEGILLLEVESKVLLSYLGEPLPMGAVLLRTSDNAVLYSALWGVGDELGFFDSAEENFGMIESEQALKQFSAITLRYGEDQEEALAALDKLHRTLLVVLLLDLIVLVVGIVVAGRAVVHPITAMTEQLKQQEQAPTLEFELELEGVREVDHLVSTYNQLQQTTRRLNDVVKEQFETMNQVFSSMADALVLLDEDGNIVEVNPAAANLLGETVDGLVMRPISQFVKRQEAGGEVVLHPTQGEDIPALLAESRSQDSRYTIWVLHDLRERLKAEQQEQYGAFQAGIAEMGASVIHNIGNAITGMIGNVANIKKQMQIVGRVGGLLQGQAGQVNQGTEPEIKEPERMLQLLSQSGELLNKISGEEGVLEYLQKLDHAIQHVGEVITIQQSAARPVIHSTQFRFYSLLSDTLGLIQDALDKHHITFRSEQDESTPRLFLPRNPMIQLLLNLIKNSMEAVVEQMAVDPLLQGEIVLTTQLLSADCFEVRIKDNGCGLEQSKLEAVFQSHFSTKERGSGYGLHSAGNFVAMLGGEIFLQSEGVGQGAEMVIRLPTHFEERN